MTNSGTLDALLRHERRIVLCSLVAVLVLAWTWTLAGAGMGMSAFEMTAMTGPRLIGAAPGAAHGEAASPMPDMADAISTQAPWTPGYAAVVFTMWWMMMIAMMLPSAAPMILLYARVHRRHQARLGPYASTASFALGYIVTWGVFSTAATAAQWYLEHAGALSPLLASEAAWLGAAILVAAGVWQLTPVKHACLRRCRAPVEFLSRRWRPGRGGAFAMGVEHGAFCVGCCWVLMSLLFFGGIMNLWWIAGLALLVLLEKTMPAGHGAGRMFGVGLILWGLGLVAMTG